MQKKTQIVREFTGMDKLGKWLYILANQLTGWCQGMMGKEYEQNHRPITEYDDSSNANTILIRAAEQDMSIRSGQ